MAPGYELVLVGSDSVRYTASDGSSRTEERLGSRLILALAQQHIDQVAVPINGPIEVDPTPLHFQIGFVAVPAPPHLPTPLPPESLAQHGSQFGFPLRTAS